MVHCRGCGHTIHESAVTCPKCGASQGQAPRVDNAELPEGVRGWSWGAFLLNWLWGPFNGVWISLLAIVPFVGFVVAIILGFKGREWAWRNKKWQSVEHFQRVQRAWSVWALSVIGGVFVLGIVAAVAIPAYGDYQRRAAASKRAADSQREEQIARAQEAERTAAMSRSQESAQPAQQQPPQSQVPATSIDSAPQGANAGDTFIAQAAACATPSDCVEAMLRGASPRRPDVIQLAASRLQKVGEQGDRKASRELNTLGLSKFSAGDYQAAAELFSRADALNSSDAEVKSNLGLTYVKLGKPRESINSLVQALEIDPRRSSAWAPFAEALHQAQLPHHSVGALLLTYEFSGNKQKTVEYFRTRSASDPADAMRTTFEQVSKIVEAGY